MCNLAHYLITTARCLSRSTSSMHAPDSLTLFVAVTIFHCLMSFVWTTGSQSPASSFTVFEAPLASVSQ
jgi:hypothetical protein